MTSSTVASKQILAIKDIFLIGPQLVADEQLHQLLLPLDYNVTTFNCASDALAAPSTPEKVSTTLFVLYEFTTSEFVTLATAKPPRAIIGSPALRSWLLSMSSPHSVSTPFLPPHPEVSLSTVPKVISIEPGRHYHNFHMKDLLLCFYGFKDKKEADKFLNLCRWMGGRVRKDFSNKIHVLISGANEAKTNKYRMALNFDTPILRKDWIEYAWANRFNPNFNPRAKEVIDTFQVKALAGLKLAFVNFSGKDLAEMIQVTKDHDGSVVDPCDPTCSHIVIDTIRGQENQVDFDFNAVPNLPSIYVVYKLWFWSSVELGRADEGQEDHAYPIIGSKNSPAHPPRSSIDGFFSPKNDYSISFTSPTILTKSFFDSSILISTNNLPKPAIDPGKASDRFKVCYELLETEKNYFNILQAIVNVFQKPLELLNYLDPTEMKHIFGNVQPLVDVHEQIYSQLQNLIEISWREENAIASVFIEHGQALLKAYPAFVNFFEDTKATIASCESKSPKFHAFLKKCESNPQCMRQSLQELLITPVQRLPRYLLLLEAIRKKTPPHLNDHKLLQDASGTIEDVLTHINEDKRKTEGQMLMFEVVKDIEGGELLLSSRRSFVTKVDAKLIVKNENSQPVLYKGHVITLFLFNDMLEICKKRTVKRTDSLTSRATLKSTPTRSGLTSSTSSKKSYRHIEKIEFTSMKSLCHFSESGTGFDDAILIQTSELTSDSKILKQYAFLITNSKVEFVKKLRMYCNRALQEGHSSSTCNLNSNSTGTRPVSIIRKGSQSDLGAFDFSYAEMLASSLSKSSFGSFGKTAKARLTRTFSVSRRQSMLHLGLNDNKNSPMIYSVNQCPSSPSVNQLPTS